MNRYAKIAISGAALLAIGIGIGCTNPATRTPALPPETPYTPDEQLANQKLKHGDTSGAARIYANLGEGILFSHGPVTADVYFDKSLAKDATNAKALFYSAMTKPLVAMSGFLSRAEGVLSEGDPSSPDDVAKVERARSDLEAMDFPELYAWAYTIPDGKKFSSLHDIQRFLRTELLPVLDESTAKLAELDPQNLPALLFSFNKYHPHDPVLQSGKITGVRPDESPLVCQQHDDGTWFCAPGAKSVLPRAVQLDRSDFAVISHAIQAIGDYVRLNTAYSAEGFDEARAAIRDQRGATHEQVVTTLRRYPNLFVLETDQLLSQIQKTTYDTLKAAEDLHSMSAMLCRNPRARIQANAFFAAICVEDSLLEAVADGLQVLNGPGGGEISLGRDADGNQVRIVADVPRILANPPKDLKPLMATEFGQAGNPIGFADPTFGGLFPNADFAAASDRVVRRADWNRVPGRMRSYGIIPYPYR